MEKILNFGDENVIFFIPWLGTIRYMQVSQSSMLLIRRARFTSQHIGHKSNQERHFSENTVIF